MICSGNCSGHILGKLFLGGGKTFFIIVLMLLENWWFFFEGVIYCLFWKKVGHTFLKPLLIKKWHETNWDLEKDIFASILLRPYWANLGQGKSAGEGSWKRWVYQIFWESPLNWMGFDYCFSQGSGISKPPVTWDPMTLRGRSKNNLELQMYSLRTINPPRWEDSS